MDNDLFCARQRRDEAIRKSHELLQSWDEVFDKRASTQLASYLASVAERPFVWGSSDCSMVVFDWVAERCGVDPVPDLRGAYVDEAGARAQIAAAGSLAALFAERFDRLSLVSTETPKPGDVAVVIFHGLEFGAIRAASGWVVKTTNGLVISEAFQLSAAWSV